MKPRLGVFMAVLAVGAVLAASALASTSASGALTNGGVKRYTLTVTNTGTDAIHCMRFTAAAGVVIATVSGPAGTSQNGPTQFGAQDITIVPGANAAWSFTTEQDYPVGGGGTLDVSATCAQGSDVSSQVSGPPAQTTPTPTATPTPTQTPVPGACKCIRLSVLASHIRTPVVNDKIDFDFNLAWTMICLRGTGGCHGTIILTPPGGGWTIRLPRRALIECDGPCAKTTEDNFRVSMRTRPGNFSKQARANRTYKVKIRMTCQGKRVAPLVLQFHFDRNGVFDRKGSKLH